MGEYQALFRSYVAELGEAKEQAETWWQALIEVEAESAGSVQEGEARVRERWPFGPTSHPYVIGVYRKYFLACERLSEKASSELDAVDDEPLETDWGVEEETTAAPGPEDIPEPDGSVDSPTFLFEFLHGRRQDLADFMMYLVFAPIGEENDRAA